MGRAGGGSLGVRVHSAQKFGLHLHREPGARDIDARSIKLAVGARRGDHGLLALTVARISCWLCNCTTRV